MDSMIGSYLERRGKSRYCDKSLGTARFAELLARVYPEARFVCLYRHPMDVIASGIEACPWGLAGYGFDPYISATPGNMVLALASFWADATRIGLAVEKRFPGRCHRVRYEDLVSDPENTAAKLFKFLDVAAAPGISGTCFSAERERFGPADYKIWFTSEITAGSVGRGWSIPAEMIPPPFLAQVNEMVRELGYLMVDEDWGTSLPPADLRAAASTARSDSHEAGDADSIGPGNAACQKSGDAVRNAASAGAVVLSSRPVHSRGLGEQLRRGLASVNSASRARWGAQAAETFVAVAVTKNPAWSAEHWLVDLAALTVTLTDDDAQQKSDWDVVGTFEAWEQVMGRGLNLQVAIRSCQLRYCENSSSSLQAGPGRLAILSQLLGLTNW
jgi:hypothetical protein